MSENDIVTQPQSPSLPDAPGQQPSKHRVRLAGYVVGIMLAFGITALVFWVTAAMKEDKAIVATSAPAQEATSIPLALQRPIVTEEGLVEKSGVRLVYVAITGGGGLIDLRFQIVDPDTAGAIHGKDTPPVIIDMETGLIVDQTLMGHSMAGELVAGKTQYIIFENPGNILQRGSMVSVLLGDAQVDNIIVK